MFSSRDAHSTGICFSAREGSIILLCGWSLNNWTELQVRQAWVEKILTTERWPAYTEMRARIYLRKQNKEITKDEVKKAAHLLRPHGSKKKGERQDGWEGKLNEVDVLNALVQGDEVCCSIEAIMISFLIISPSPGSTSVSLP